MAEWVVYILECADGSLYTGVATDVATRVAKHNAGKGAKYTRGRLPAKLVYRETAAGRGAALRREHAIKRLSRDAKLQLISSGTANRPRRRLGGVRRRRAPNTGVSRRRVERDA